jgi:hypothetical protein
MFVTGCRKEDRKNIGQAELNPQFFDNLGGISDSE